MWHSLEHISEPVKLLSAIACKLNENGLIFIRVPAFDCNWRKLLGQKWIWFQPQNHLFHYTKKSMEYVLTSSGYKPLVIEHRKPNDRFTRKMLALVYHLFHRNFGLKSNLMDRLKRIYEDVTGIEIYAVAKKINI
jgi:hypothetical protein